MASWISIDEESDFSLQNLPYGIFSTSSVDQRIGVAIGDFVLDLKVLANAGIFSNLDFDTLFLEDSTLNRYAGLGRKVHRQVRALLQILLSAETSQGSILRDNASLRERALVPVGEVTLHLPFTIGDYTDFFVVPYHAQNCTDIFRPGQKLSESFFEQPLGYHGRASSVVISGTPLHRPRGQFVVNNNATFGPCQKLDYEVEFAAFVGTGNEMGHSIDVNDAENHIFGFVLLNDWSARDIQRREAAPLGPFNGKNFCTTISPWVVTLDALEPFRTTPLRQGPWLDYLSQENKESAYDIKIEVLLKSEYDSTPAMTDETDVPAAGSNSYHMSKCNTKNVVFSFPQMLAHHTAGGCPMRTGDLIATGTLSGKTRSEYGCLLESTKDGIEPYEVVSTFDTNTKLRRTFLEDGDSITFKAKAQGQGAIGNVGFGTCQGGIRASL